MQEEDADVQMEKESRDAKSRHVLRDLEAGKIRYLRGGKLTSPKLDSITPWLRTHMFVTVAAYT